MPDLESWLAKLVRVMPFGPLYLLRFRPRQRPTSCQEGR